MILEACEFQRQELEGQIQLHTEGLVRGAPTRDDDQRTRGIIQGLRLALAVVDTVVERVKRAESEG